LLRLRIIDVNGSRLMSTATPSGIVTGNTPPALTVPSIDSALPRVRDTTLGACDTASTVPARAQRGGQDDVASAGTSNSTSNSTSTARAPDAGLILTTPQLYLEILPQWGGGIGRFDWREGAARIPVLRGCADPTQVDDPNQLACYPLLPFSNRIGGGRFAIDGRTVALAPNRADEALPIHGDGWQLPWQVERHSSCEARLTLDRSAARPYAYHAAQTFTLEGASLKLVLEVTNTGAQTLPFGLGIHPFIERDDDTLLAAPAGGLWLSGPDWLSTEHVRTPPAWQFGIAYPLPERLVNHAFTDWAGWMTARWPQRQLLLTIQADTACFVLYTPPSEDWFCFEPVDHPINAMNLAGGGAAHGMTLLAPGATLSRTFTLSVERTGEWARPRARPTFYSTTDEIR